MHDYSWYQSDFDYVECLFIHISKPKCYRFMKVDLFPRYLLQLRFFSICIFCQGTKILSISMFSFILKNTTYAIASLPWPYLI